MRSALFVAYALLGLLLWCAFRLARSPLCRSAVVAGIVAGRVAFGEAS